MENHLELLNKFNYVHNKLLSAVDTYCEEWYEFHVNGIISDDSVTSEDDLFRDKRYVFLCQHHGSATTKELLSYFHFKLDTWDQQKREEVERESEYRSIPGLMELYDVTDSEVEDYIFQNAEKLYEEGWEFNEDALRKYVQGILLQEKEEERKPEHEKVFSSQDWRQGWLILRYLDDKIEDGTKIEQLEWLRKALVYHGVVLDIFQTKQGYARAVKYEEVLRGQIFDETLQIHK